MRTALLCGALFILAFAPIASAIPVDCVNISGPSNSIFAFWHPTMNTGDEGDRMVVCDPCPFWWQGSSWMNFAHQWSAWSPPSMGNMMGNNFSSFVACPPPPPCPELPDCMTLSFVIPPDPYICFPEPATLAFTIPLMLQLFRRRRPR